MRLTRTFEPDADKFARHVVAFCQTMQRFADQEILRDLTFELHAVTSVFCHGSSFQKPGRPVNSSSRSVHPKGRTPTLVYLWRDFVLEIVCGTKPVGDRGVAKFEPVQAESTNCDLVIQGVV